MKRYFKGIIFLICYLPFMVRYTYFRKRGLFPKVISSEETLKKIRDEKISISRIGDGELKISRGMGIGFQHVNHLLQQRMHDLIELPIGNNFYLCIPDIFHGFSKYKFRTALFWKYNLFWNWDAWLSFQTNRMFLDSLSSRFYMESKSIDYSTNIIGVWKSIWKDRDIVIVEGGLTRLGVGNDLFDGARSVKRILAPAKNAFDRYDKIVEECRKIDNSELFLIALGPTATIMAKELSSYGYQAIDIGHIDIEYEWYLRRAKKKISIPGKYVNEVKKHIDDRGETVCDDRYGEQIISRIS